MTPKETEVQADGFAELVVTEPDKTTTLAVIIVLGLLAISVVVGGIVLAMSDRGMPDALIAIGSAAAGAVGTVLVRAR